MAPVPFSWLIVTAVWLERSPLPGLKRAATWSSTLYPPACYSSCMVCATKDHVVVSDLVILEGGGITKRWTLVGGSLVMEGTSWEEIRRLWSFLLFSFLPGYLKQAMHSPTYRLPWCEAFYRLKAIGPAGTSETVSQNYPFLFLSWFSKYLL